MKRTLIVLVAALALLAVVLLKSKSNEKAMQKDVPALDSTRRAEAKSLRVVKKPDTVSLEVKDGKWVVAKDAFPVDTGKINRVLKYVFAIQRRELVSTSKERLAEYGLDSTEAKHVTVKNATGASMAELVIGKTSGADYSSTYWKWENGPEVYRTPGNFTWEIGTKEDEWKDRKIFGFTAKDLKFIEVNWTDTGKAKAAYHYKLEALTDSTWKMLEPQDSNRVVKSMTSDMSSRLADLSIDDFVGAKDTNVTKANIDSPMVAIKATLKDGKVKEVKAGKTLDGYAYAKHPERSEIIKLSSWRLDAFKKKPFELLEAPPAADSTKKDAKPAAPAPGDDGHGHAQHEKPAHK
jgi:hypothetical protein